MPAAPIRTAIVEDHHDYRVTLELVLKGAPGFACAGAFATVEESLLMLPKARPDVVLVDIRMGRRNGVEIVRQLKPLQPATQFVMLTVVADAEMLFEALAAGATGYLLKDTTPAEVLVAVREVHAGGSPMSPAIARLVVTSLHKPLPADSPLTELTMREREILNGLAKGLIYKEIADRMAISYETVHCHVRSIYSKLQVRSRAQAVARYMHQPDA
ncbi:MAG: response regulator transcription factor [Limisphaerales bacterium]